MEGLFSIANEEYYIDLDNVSQFIRMEPSIDELLQSPLEYDEENQKKLDLVEEKQIEWTEKDVINMEIRIKNDNYFKEAVAVNDMRMTKRVCDECGVDYKNRLALEGHMMVKHGHQTAENRQTMIITPQITNKNYQPH